jgi:glyoxylase-like metal-dependent hydrolase (beta-lactamase superfamily II)
MGIIAEGSGVRKGRIAVPSEENAMTPSAPRSSSLTRSWALAAFGLAAAFLATAEPSSAAAKLALDVFTAEPAGFGVTSTLIYGPTEALLVDAQFRGSDATKLAARIRAIAPGRKLKAIVVSHPHPDHYFGLPTLLHEFPGTPVYLSSQGLKDFDATVAQEIATWSKVYGNEIPATVGRPLTAPARFTVDGETLEHATGVQGDAHTPDNAYLWIPSLRALVASDLAYSGAHVWLADSTAATRTAWRRALTDLEGRKAEIVIAGHKGSATLPDTPASLAFTKKYIEQFEAALAASKNAEELKAKVKAQQPDLGLEPILDFAAQAAFGSGH